MVADEELVRRVGTGDETALAELLRRYERPLSHFLYRHTGGRDVEDLYQETWLRVVRSATRFDPDKRFSTWLFQIGLNLCRDWYRRRQPEQALLEESDAPGPDHIGRAEAGLDAAALLAELPLAQREVVLLRYYRGLTEEETADVLECPRGTVKSRMHNALARLAALVKREET